MNTTASTVPGTSSVKPIKGAFAAIAVLPFGLHGLAFACAAAPFASMAGSRLLSLLVVAPAVYAMALTGLCAAIARPAARWIRAGRFNRDEADREYVARRLYGTCWTTLYYCKPVYFLMLSVPILRRAVFRAFGYRGASLDFTIYPDAWIRDLPLLDFGQGVYVSNRATLGTNVVRPGGQIHVDKVTLGARSIVGHLAMLAPGVRTGADTEIGVGSALGFKVILGDGVRIGGGCTVDHATRIGARTRLGHSVHIGLRCRIGAGLRLPSGMVVPDFSSLVTQADVDRLGAPGSRIERPTPALSTVSPTNRLTA